MVCSCCLININHNMLTDWLQIFIPASTRSWVRVLRRRQRLISRPQRPEQVALKTALLARLQRAMILCCDVVYPVI